jgi:hypothetical protein
MIRRRSMNTRGMCACRNWKEVPARQLRPKDVHSRLADSALPQKQAGNRARTDDLLITNQLLYQLSYAGIYSGKRPLNRSSAGRFLYALSILGIRGCPPDGFLGGRAAMSPRPSQSLAGAEAFSKPHGVQTRLRRCGARRTFVSRGSECRGAGSWIGSRCHNAPMTELCARTEQTASAARMENPPPVRADFERLRRNNLGNYGSSEPGPIPALRHLLRAVQGGWKTDLEEPGDEGVFRREATAPGRYPRPSSSPGRPP